MFERFSDRARKAVQLANEEAQRFNHEYIGTEHLLLGLVREGSGLAAKALDGIGIDLRNLRLEVEKMAPPGPDLVIASRLPQTPRAKRAIEQAIEEAASLAHGQVDTAHLLLGLLREGEGGAAQVLRAQGHELAAVRQAVLAHLARANLEAGGGSAPRKPVALGLVDWFGLPLVECPDDLREALQVLDARIAEHTSGKEAAVAAQDFEQAAHLRDQADRLKKQKAPLRREWWQKHRPDPAWLAWQQGQVLALARSIEEERRWGDLPVLADALEEARCTDQQALRHCRAGLEHPVGCWVVHWVLYPW